MIDLGNYLDVATKGMEALKLAKDMSALFRDDTPEVIRTPVREPTPKRDPTPESIRNELPVTFQLPPVTTSATSEASVKSTQRPLHFEASISSPHSLKSPPTSEDKARSRLAMQPSFHNRRGLTFMRQSTMVIPRIPRERSQLFVPKRKKNDIVTTQDSGFGRRNSIPLRRQSSNLDRPLMMFRQRTQTSYPFNSCFPEVKPLPPLRRSKTILNNTSVGGNEARL